MSASFENLKAFAMLIELVDIHLTELLHSLHAVLSGIKNVYAYTEDDTWICEYCGIF